MPGFFGSGCGSEGGCQGQMGVSKIADDLCLKSKISMFRQCNIDEGTISSRERANDAIYADVFSRVVWLRRLYKVCGKMERKIAVRLWLPSEKIGSTTLKRLPSPWWVIRSWVRIGVKLFSKKKCL